MAYLKDDFLLYRLFTGLCTWNNIIMYYFYHLLSSNYKIRWLLWQRWSHNYFPPLTFKKIFFVSLFCVLVKTSLLSSQSLSTLLPLLTLSNMIFLFLFRKGQEKEWGPAPSVRSLSYLIYWGIIEVTLVKWQFQHWIHRPCEQIAAGINSHIFNKCVRFWMLR